MTKFYSDQDYNYGQRVLSPYGERSHKAGMRQGLQPLPPAYKKTIIMCWLQSWNVIVLYFSFHLMLCVDSGWIHKISSKFQVASRFQE